MRKPRPSKAVPGSGPQLLATEGRAQRLRARLPFSHSCCVPDGRWDPSKPQVLNPGMEVVTGPARGWLRDHLCLCIFMRGRHPARPQVLGAAQWPAEARAHQATQTWQSPHPELPSGPWGPHWSQVRRLAGRWRRGLLGHLGVTWVC